MGCMRQETMTGRYRGDRLAMLSISKFWIRSGEGRWYSLRSMPRMRDLATCMEKSICKQQPAGWQLQQTGDLPALVCRRRQQSC